MVPKKKFRISSRYKEIFGIISKAKKGEKNFIWKMVKEKRIIIPVAIEEVQSLDNRIGTRLREDTDSLEVGDQVYLKLDSRDSAFKTEVLELKGALVTLAFPDEMVMNENRATDRHYFHFSDEKMVQLSLLGQPKSVLIREGEKSYSLAVSDLSETGLALFVPQDLGYEFALRSKIKLEMLGLYVLEKALVGEIVFKMEHELKTGTAREPGFKIGIQLDAKIPRALLERFILKKKLFTITDERIVGDEAFHKKVHALMRKMEKDLSAKKQFKAFFAALDIQRADYQYLRQHISLLGEVLSGLALKLGWTGGKTIEKLIYCAYLHDIRLMESPKLARIQTKKEFEVLKPRLTAAEQKAYLEAPAFASELARKDSESYPDAPMILLQQKELPDGAGFPNGLSAPDITPLSTLFILSHCFVDYVIGHPDWSISDFKRTYRPRLKSAQFQKIFEVMEE